MAFEPEMFLNILNRGGKSDKKWEKGGKSIQLYPVFSKSRYFSPNSFMKEMKMVHKKR